MLSKDDYSILRLFRSRNVGPFTFFKILKMFNGNSSDAIDNIAEFNRKTKSKIPIVIAPKDEIDREIVACSTIGAKIISYKNNLYPWLLREIDNFPPILTVLGNIELLKKDSISIVGSRNASSNGCNFARKISRELGEAGYVITSGFASGIDSAAHRGALETGTIAVLGGGIDNIYPRGNEELYYQIKNRGLIISESPFNSAPKAENFPSRNRIVSGLSKAVIVIEAGARSGTIHTARQALEQNRELLVAPGNPYDPRCDGSNQLLKTGATPITSSEDVLEIVDSFNFVKKEDKFILSDNNSEFHEVVCEDKPGNELYDFNEECKEEEPLDIMSLILSKLNHTPIAVDTLSYSLEIDIKTLNVNLAELELDGKIIIENGKVSIAY